MAQKSHTQHSKHRANKISHIQKPAMTIRHIVISASAALAACTGSVKSSQTDGQTQTVPPEVTFSADSAYSFVSSQTAFGPRTPGSKAHADCVDYLTAKMRQFGAEVTLQEVTGTAYDGAPTPVRNIIASYRPDTWCIGSQMWGKGPGKDAQHLFGILLDMVGDSSAVFPVELFSKSRAADIVDKVWTMAEMTGHGNRFVRTEGSYVTDDHYYINKLTSVPTIDIIHYDQRNEKGFCDTWHTQDDTIDHICAETLKDVGEVVLAVVYAEK